MNPVFNISNPLLIIAGCVLLLCGALLAKDHSDEDDDRGEFNVTDRHWQAHKTKYKKKFDGPEKEKKHRHNFRKNLTLAMKHNAEAAKGAHTYLLSTDSHFIDLGMDELSNSYGLILPAGLNVPTGSQATNPLLHNPLTGIPSSVDMSSSPCMQPIKNQGPCGSCWAFAAIAPIEYLLCKKSKIPIRLSEQQLIDCSYGFAWGNFGCSGGWPQNGWNYGTNFGFMPDSAYSYTAEDGGFLGTKCRYKLGSAVVSVLSSANLASDENAILTKVAAGIPVAAAVCGACQTFQLYGGGVYNDPSCIPSKCAINHAVVVCGYGTTPDGQPYWKIRNSWGSSWGEGGYARIARGNNMNGITTKPSTVEIR